jgi:hypothetical protein
MSVRQSTADHGDGMGLDKDEPLNSNHSRRGTGFKWRSKSKENARNHGLSLDLFTEDNHVLKKLLEEALNAAAPAASARTSGTSEVLRGLAKIPTGGSVDTSLQFSPSGAVASNKGGRKRVNKPSVDMMNMEPPVATLANHTHMLKIWRSRPDVIVYGVVSDWSR